jgi:hypothetical protein
MFIRAETLSVPTVADIILSFSVLSIPVNYILYVIDPLFQGIPILKISLAYYLQFFPIVFLIYGLYTKQYFYNTINNLKFRNIKLIIPVLVLALIEINLDVQSFVYTGLTSPASEIWNHFFATGEIHFINVFVLVAALLLLSKFVSGASEIKFSRKMNLTFTGSVALLSMLFVTYLMLITPSHLKINEEFISYAVLSVLFFIVVSILILFLVLVVPKFITSGIGYVGYIIPGFITGILFLNLINYTSVIVLLVSALIFKYVFWTSVIRHNINKSFLSSIAYNKTNNISNWIFGFIVVLLTTMETMKDQIITLILTIPDSFLMSNKINSYASAYDPQFTISLILLNQTVIFILIGIMLYAANKIR